MLKLLGSLLNIRPNEWPRALMIYAMGMLFLIGMTWGETVAEASFLASVGVGVLPVIFVADAVISIIAIAVYTLFVDRMANDRLLIAILVVSTVAVIAGRLLIAADQTALAYPFLYLVSRVVRDTFNLQWWTYVTSFYDARTAKRVIPVLSTSARTAGIVGGLTIPPLIALVMPQNMIVLWAVALLGVAALAALMPRVVKDDPADASSARPGPAGGASSRSYIRNVREGYHYVAQSSFLRMMALSTLVLMVLFALMTYQTSVILKAELKTTEAISGFLSTLTWVSNLIMMPVPLLLLGRIVSRIGLGNANLMFPFGTTLTNAALAFLPGSLPIAGLAYFNRTTFRTTIRNVIDNLLYNAVPLRVKGRARAFISGLVVPFGSLIGGTLLLLLPALAGLPWFVPALIVAFTLAYLFTAIKIRRQYADALVTMLEQEEYSFLLSSPSDLSITDASTFNWLKNKLAESKSSEITIFLAKLISESGGEDCVPILREIARGGDPTVRVSILNTLMAADLRGEEVTALFTEFLADPDWRVRQAAVAGLMQEGSTDETTLALALNALKDPEIEVRIQALPVLIRLDDPFYIASAVQALAPILSHPDPRWKARGISVLSQVRDVRFILTLSEFLDDPDDEVRLEAVIGIEALVQAHPVPRRLAALLVTEMQRLLHDPVERIRRAALTILGRVQPDAATTLVAFLTDSSPTIREAAVDALVATGRSIVPMLTELAERGDGRRRRMAAVALCRLHPARAHELIRAFIVANLSAIYANHVRLAALEACSGGRGIGILQAVLRERNTALLDEVFYLLAAGHDPKAVRLIAESLASDQPRVRANAVEAVESYTSPQIARLVAPLFERDSAPAQFLTLARSVSGLDANISTVLRELASGATKADKADTSEAEYSLWARAVAIYTLGEIWAAPPALPAPAANGGKADASRAGADGEAPKKPRARRAMADLLGSLSDAPESPASEAAKPAADALPPDKPADPAPLPAAAPVAVSAPPTPCQAALTSLPRAEAERLIAVADADSANRDSQVDLYRAALAARRLLEGSPTAALDSTLSTIERVIFLKAVSFFAGMTVDQLRILARVCEEASFREDALIYREGETSGVLYVVVRGKVAIERPTGRAGSTARIGTAEAYQYFGEIRLFDNSPHTERAIALQDTLTLRLRREPLLALIRQAPDLSFTLINVLSARLRQANDRIAQLTTVKAGEMNRLFDKLE